MYGLKQEHIHSINGCFARYSPVKKVILYGSRAKGTYRPGSDIDLTIVDDELKHADFLKLLNEIDDLMLPYKIDLSLKREINNTDLLEHVDRVGKVFYAKKEGMIAGRDKSKGNVSTRTKRERD